MNAALAPAVHRIQRGEFARIPLEGSMPVDSLCMDVDLGDCLVVARGEKNIRAYIFDQDAKPEYLANVFDEALLGRLVCTSLMPGFHARDVIRKGLRRSNVDSSYADSIKVFPQWVNPHADQPTLYYMINSQNPDTLVREIKKLSVHGTSYFLPVESFPLLALTPSLTPHLPEHI